jgi:adenosylmethionine-8-amino-7-oxononanoate aminotransferase
MAICDPEEGMHSLFSGLLPEHPVISLPRDAASVAAFDLFLEEHAATLAAIIVEPLVQGAGGMVFHDASVLRHLRRAADHYGLTLIFDEIFTAFGRTGTMFACEQAGVVPDIITLSKALTGGTMALSAAIARTHIFAAFLSENAGHALMHGPTYMANPLACSAALASLELFAAEPRLAQVEAIGAAMGEQLAPCRCLPGVRDLRVLGAIGVVELHRIADMNALKAALAAAGVWVRPFRNIVYLTPAFTIAAEELAFLCGAVRRVLERAPGNIA